MQLYGETRALPDFELRNGAGNLLLDQLAASAVDEAVEHPVPDNYAYQERQQDHDGGGEPPYGQQGRPADDAHIIGRTHDENNSLDLGNNGIGPPAVCLHHADASGLDRAALLETFGDARAGADVDWKGESAAIAQINATIGGRQVDNGSRKTDDASMLRDIEASPRSVGKKTGDGCRNGIFAWDGGRLGVYHPSVNQIDMEEVGIWKSNDADVCADGWRIAAVHERNGNIASVVCPDEKLVSVPDGRDNAFDAAQVRRDNDRRIHVRYVFKRRHVAGFIVGAEQGFDFCCAGDVDGVSTEEAAAALVEHERSGDAYLCAEKAVKIVSRQVSLRYGGVERDAAAPEDEVVEARVDFVMEGVDDDAARSNRPVHQFAAVCGIEVAQVHIYRRRRIGATQEDEVVNFCSAVADEVRYAVPAHFEPVAWRNSPSAGKFQPDGP